ncbi:MAG: hypothetical protein KAT43_00970 [Nanoarchaeota archaeon]|nr:hypothetical protein [Nanoarchaeota archaeon]
MDPDEKKLWHMIDVGDFMSVGSIFSCNLQWIEESLGKDEKDFRDEISKCRETYKLLEDRFAEMDLDKLDARFPAEELRIFRETTLPEFKRRLSGLYFLLEQYPAVSKFVVGGSLDACGKSVDQMAILRRSFANSGRYSMYRKTNPARKCLLAEIRARYPEAV